MVVLSLYYTDSLFLSFPCLYVGTCVFLWEVYLYFSECAVLTQVHCVNVCPSTCVLVCAVHVHVSMCSICLCVSAFLCGCMWRPETQVGGSFPPFFFETGSCTELSGLCFLARLVSECQPRGCS